MITIASAQRRSCSLPASWISRQWYLDSRPPLAAGDALRPAELFVAEDAGSSSHQRWLRTGARIRRRGRSSAVAINSRHCSSGQALYDGLQHGRRRALPRAAWTRRSCSTEQRGSGSRSAETRRLRHRMRWTLLQFVAPSRRSWNQIRRSCLDTLGGSGYLAIVRAIERPRSRARPLDHRREGVETQEQLDVVRSEGCTEMQGFLFSKPKAGLRTAGLFSSYPVKAPKEEKPEARRSHRQAKSA